jgi:CubicO group peptidase (beta-lactamase class C family)
MVESEQLLAKTAGVLHPQFSYFSPMRRPEYFKNAWLGRLLVCSIVFLCPVIAVAQSVDTLRQIDNLFSHWNNATPGGSVAVERDGKIIYHKAFGLSDLEYNVPNTIETIFEGGSLSKQFTAMAALLLVSEGKLSLQDDVRKYVPELPSYPGTITIQHLLNHTSGLKDWGVIGSIEGWPRTTRVYTQELALQIICRQRSLNFYPGNEYSYSNSNYSLLVTIVERISKRSLADFTQEKLFGPAGMRNTQWRDNFKEVIPGRAVAYERSGGKYLQDMPFENVHGHGGVLTTTGDLVVWNRQLATHQIGGDQVYKMRIQQGKLNGGKDISYASGLSVQKRNGFTEINHTGATAGYRAVLSYYPEKKLSIAILSNDGSFSPGLAGGQVADIFLGKSQPRKQPTANIAGSEEALKKFEGIYRSVREFDVFTLTYSPGKISSHDGALHVLHPDTLYLDGLYWIAKKPGQMLLKNTGDTATYVKVNPPKTDVASLKEFVGQYQSTEANTIYNVEWRDSGIWINIPAHGSFKLTPSFLDGFLADDEDLYEFKRTKGVVDRFEISTSRAERIPFLKTKAK